MMTIVIQNDCVVDDTFYRQGEVAKVDDGFDKTNIRKVIETSIQMKNNLQIRKNTVSNLKKVKNEQTK